jgi:ADP-heptose:LPS heptosyltransferase
MPSNTPPNNPPRILVIKLGALGDFVQALGPMRAIRAHHPGEHITLLTTKPYADIAQKSRIFDSILLDTRPKWHDLRGWIILCQTFNAGRFNRVYDLQNSDRTGFYFKLFSPRPEWVGIAKGASHRNTSPDRSKGLAFYGHVQTLSLAGITDIEIDPLEWMTADTSAFNLPERYALIVPGSAPNRPEKRWPAEYYAAICDDLVAIDITPVLVGSEAERETLDLISNKRPLINLAGRTVLMDIPALARGALIAVGNDTGPMHLIAPTGCPTLVLFSEKTNPLRHSPLGDRIWTIQKKNLKDLSVEHVSEEIRKILNQTAPSSGR